MRRWIRRLAAALVVLALAVAAVLVLGPREPVDTRIDFDPAAIGDDIDAYLARREARFDDITPGVQKRVVWAGEKGARTHWAVVYLHGYSATSEEIRPVPDRVAAVLGANLFYTRLAGHGRPGEALGRVTAGDWIEDLAEAMEIGRRLGEKVLILSTSTGGTLATVAAADPQLSQGLAGIVFISPNFKVADPAAALLSLPFVRIWGPWVAGAEQSWEPRNEGQARYWTTRYPTVALVPMQALVDYVAGIDKSRLTVPALFIYSPEDKVVSPAATEAVARAWGGPKRIEKRHMGPGDDPMSHVIAGDIMSPGQTAETVAIILDWVRGLE